MKKCNKCGIEKELSEFHERRKKCKDCKNEEQRRIKIDHPERYAKYQKRASWYKKQKLYGLNQEQYENMVKDQNNSCAICLNKFKDKRGKHVDHSHKTDKVRGILCNSCNLALGKFKDSPDYLKSAILYLRRK